MLRTILIFLLGAAAGAWLTPTADGPPVPALVKLFAPENDPGLIHRPFARHLFETL
jgi:hypothetical protein